MAIKVAKMGDKLRLQKLAFSRVLSRDLGLWVSAALYHRGNYWKSRRLHRPLPNSRCGPASDYLWGYV